LTPRPPRRFALVAFIALACGPRTPPSAAPASAQPLPPPHPAAPPLPPGVPTEAAALVPLLVARDAAPTLCGDLAIRLPDAARRVAALAALAEQVAAPPWAAIRAADCLAREAPALAGPPLLRWAPNPAHLGLTLAALQRLDDLPADLALALAAAAWAGGAAPAPVRAAILRAERPEVRAVVEEATAP
jgi:hypothetical protein